MAISKERIHYLLEVYISGKATALEEKELMEWILEAGEDSELKDYMLKTWNDFNSETEDYSYVNWNEIYSRVMLSPVVALKSNVKKLKWIKLSAVASIAIAIAAGAYFYFTNTPKQAIAANVPQKQTDITPPSVNKAVLTLSNGTKIEIDSIGKGTIALQGNVRIIKQANGEIAYTGNGSKELIYNTLTVPRGSKPLGLTLSDGSHVWLNVGSSLTYPTAFTGKKREVKITGEAYFEVAHNSRIPFMVKHDDVMIKVVGTHFNVNTYEDESAERITLLEGSVRISKNSISQLLKPGQQAEIMNKVNDIKVLDNVNIDEVIAWKNGKFKFGEDTDIETIMRQISRWYNVDIEYKGSVKQHFWGSISKDVNVSQVLRILEATGSVKFKVDGNKIIVMPAIL